MIGKKFYYYLRASKKRGKKLITKDLAYLGSNIKDIKKTLDSLSEYKAEIRKAYKKINVLLESDYFIKRVHEKNLKCDEFLGDKLKEIEACKLHFISVFKKLDKLTKKRRIKILL